MSKNANLHKAKDAKNDEFYTQLNDVSNELKHYRPHFKDKIVLCNCDDPTWSAFWKYFHLNFELLGLKKLISTHYDREQATYKMEYTGGDDNNIEAGIKTPLEGNGDFRNAECIELLKEADIVVTNPPFSEYRSYVAQLVEYDKKFIIWSNNNSITYKEIFPLIKENKMWLGYLANKTCYFQIPDYYEKWDGKYTKQMNDGHKYGKVPAISTFTNLDIQKRHDFWLRECCERFTMDKYPMYDNYCAWNINKVTDIFIDEDIEAEVDDKKLEQIKKAYGSDATVLEAVDSKTRVKIHHPVMGVPITFLDKYNPEEFEIVELSRYLEHDGMSKQFVDEYYRQGNKGSIHEGHPDLCYYDKQGKTIVPYMRVLIKRKENLHHEDNTNSGQY